MKRHILYFSLGVALIVVLSLIVMGHRLRASARPESPAAVSAPQILDDPVMAQRIAVHGRSFAAWLDGHQDSSLVTSIAAGVVIDDRLVFSHGVNADSRTRFGVASLTKTFTAVLALRLSEQKRLGLDDPVSKYLPGVIIEREALKSKPVTVRHLLAHTSGIPACCSAYRSYRVGSAAISLPEQVYPAGYNYAYSNDGYSLMKYVIEAATGMSFGAVLRQEILGPLGMTSTTGDYSNATGGISTTLEDLAKYTAMLVNRGTYRGITIISPASFDMMLEKPLELPPTAVDYHYSLSWEVITVNGRVDSFYKAGRWFGEASGLQVFPAKRMAFIYLCNPPKHLTNAFMDWRQKLTGQLRFLLRSISGDQSLCSAWPKHTPDELRPYEGIYVNPLNGQRVTITLKGGQLFSRSFGGNYPLRTFTSNRFLIDEGPKLHNFVWKQNRVVGLALINGYYELMH